VDECVFYYKKSILLVYVDDSILLGPDEEELKFLINKMSKCFDIQEDGDLCDYLGIQVKRHADGSMTLTQPQLIDSILKDMHLDKDNSTGRRLPALSSVLIHKDNNGKDFAGNFHYRSIIGKLNYLEKSTRPDIAYAVHQCTDFSSQPKQSHGEAVKYICHYLKATKDKGLIIHPQGNKFECYVDASHAGDWKQESSMDDPSTARSRTGFIFSFAQCPVIWGSKLQTEIALSSTEAEYIALSGTIREILPVLSLAKEATGLDIITNTEKPTIQCRLFEDNQGAVELANVPKMRPRTKHINIKYHFFRQYVQDGTLQVQHISGDDQAADIFTKPLNYETFTKHHLKNYGLVTTKITQNEGV